MPMHAISDNAAFQQSLAALPLATYQAGEIVLGAASTAGRLLILKEGAVTEVKEGVEIAKVTEPGAVFGELSALLGQPHTADVHALEDSQFHVASTAAPLMRDPMALLHVATALARRVDSANRALVELKRQVQAGQPSSNHSQDERQESRDRWRPPSPACHLALVRCEAQRSTETSVRPAGKANAKSDR
jgi:CRP/FNR family cyclic AMP-dependent transcriptional regulator